MIDRVTLGRVPAKHHTTLPIDGPGGAPHKGKRIAYEHCFTRKGFDSSYSILYQRHSPAREYPTKQSNLSWHTAEPSALEPLRRAHMVSTRLPSVGTWLESRTPVLVNPDIEVSFARPERNARYFTANGDGDEMLFFYKGSATLETPFGVQGVNELDYLWIPRSCPYRLVFNDLEEEKKRPHVQVVEAKKGWSVPNQFRNHAGQLTFDAPYSHRDFGRPTRLVDPENDALGTKEGPWTIITKRHDRLNERTMDHHPCDIVGWDGYVYPVTFPILQYQPKTGKVHLPPTIHITWSTPDAVMCSFVPRKVDYAEGAIPCPYPHSSVDCDEYLLYVRGNFTSRKGVSSGSISLHPAGLPHAPQPGSYEASIGSTETDELAVMIDTFKPLSPTRWALEVEDDKYMESWHPDRFDEAENESGKSRGPNGPGSSVSK